MDKTNEIILKGTIAERVSLFRFSLQKHDNQMILIKFGLWSRYFFPNYFKSEDAPYHEEIDELNLKVYSGEIKTFTDIEYRGSAKTTRKKLFLAFCILNDKDHFRRYFKIITKDISNAKQITTDIYNMFVDPKIKQHYPNIFEKGEFKREETMGSFTLSQDYGVKVVAGTVGVEHRGKLQEAERPDYIWFDDFETRNTLRSAVITEAIWQNMEEAKTGLSPNGGCVYTCNYVSERGNVHKLVIKENDRNIVKVIPIKDKLDKPTWPQRFTPEMVKQIEEDAEDFEGEYMCEPSAGADVYFDRENLKRMPVLSPIKTVGGLKLFKRYDPSHRYASGHDVAGGVGLDSSTSVFIDFDTIPYRVVATYRDNLIKPDQFGHEIANQGNMFGECLVAPERNNHGHATIAILKQQYSNIYTTEIKDTKQLDTRKNIQKEYGWHTNIATKNKMFAQLRKMVDDGLLELSDPDLIQEAKSYSRDDLMDADVDVRLTTRHFDLLTACAIALQMQSHATYEDKQTEEQIKEIVREETEMSWEEKFNII